MSAQRRVTTPPEIRLKWSPTLCAQIALECQPAQRPIPVCHRAAPVSPHKEFRRILIYGSRAFAQALSLT